MGANDKLTRAEPATIPVGAPETPVKLIGADFENEDHVTLDGAPLGSTFVSSCERTLTLPASRLVEGSEFILAVRRGGPAGVSSAPVKVKVTK